LLSISKSCVYALVKAHPAEVPKHLDDVESRPVKTWGPFDGRGHAMFGWPMEEEAKLEFTITVNWRRKDGSIATTQLGTLDRGACRSAEDVGLQLADTKPILHALAHPEANSERFESIEAKLDELRSYLYANRESVRGYAEAYRNGERISTAHVESTVNQLINWRMCKKHQMGWSRAGAQQLLHVKTAIINGRLDRYTGHHSVPADIAA
jgi:hypothetical protein